MLFLRGPSFIHTTINDKTEIQEECSGSKREKVHGHVHSKHEWSEVMKCSENSYGVSRDPRMSS